MLPFQERKKLRKYLYSKVTLIVLFVLVALLARGAWGVHQKASIARVERDEAAKGLQELQDRTQGLQASLARLRSDRGVEEELRQKFTVARPGEEVVIVVDDEGKKSENGEASQKQGFWGWLVEFFMGE